jgi:hypothetical protein
MFPYVSLRIKKRQPPPCGFCEYSDLKAADFLWAFSCSQLDHTPTPRCSRQSLKYPGQPFRPKSIAK